MGIIERGFCTGYVWGFVLGFLWGCKIGDLNGVFK